MNEVDHLRDSMFCGRIWRDVVEQWKDKSSKNRHSINGDRTSKRATSEEPPSGVAYLAVEKVLKKAQMLHGTK